MIDNNIKETEYMSEETAFERRRKLIKAGYVIIDEKSKWSGGSSPVILLKFYYKYANK